MSELSVNRTLVKSPPELWTELSEIERLAEHLGEFGQIRITKVEPEKTVAWEGEQGSGTVEIAASGWGTKVTLTAALRKSGQEQQAEAKEVGDAAGAEPEASVEPEPEGGAGAEPEAANETVVEAAASAARTEPAPLRDPGPPARSHWTPSPPPPPQPAVSQWAPAPAQAVEPAPARTYEPPTARPAPRPEPPRRGKLARFFGRRAPEPPRHAWQAPEPARPRPSAAPAWQPPRPAHAPQQPPPPPPPPPEVRTAPAPPPEPTPAPASAEPTVAQRDPAPPRPEPKPVPDPPLDAERALAVLEGALDTLGSAHHRPFSRG